MLDIDSGEQTEALYKLFRIHGGKKEEKFKSTDINEVLAYQKHYAARYQEGLYMEIIPKKKIYNWKEKRVEEIFDV